MNKLSVIIITKNEESNIKECLEALSWADEIILVDDGSTDRTVEITTSYPHVRVFRRVMTDGFGPQKQYALEKATGEWVLSLDADERITEECKEEIMMKLSSKEFDGFCFRMKNFVFGKFIYDSKAANLRLFRRDKGSFTCSRVHEQIIVNGKLGIIDKPIIHYSRSTRRVEDYIRTLNLYTSLSAHDLYSKGRRITILTFIPYFFLHPLYLFFRLLFLRGHWKDGAAGILLSLMRVLDALVNYVKLLEIQMKKQGEDG